MVILKNEEWINEVTPDQLPEPYDRYAEVIGIREYYNFCKEFGGITIYVPKVESAFKNIIHKKIQQDFNGYNYQKLALKYHLSERTIRTIISTNGVLDGQIKMFE